MLYFLMASLLAMAASACSCLNCNDTTAPGVSLHRRWVHSFDLSPQAHEVNYRWAQDSKGFSTIKYCYQDSDTHNQLWKLVEPAWKMWLNALGGAAAKENGHRLNMEEFSEGGGLTYCYMPRATPNDPWVWNPKVPVDTLVFKIASGPGSGSSGMFAGLAYVPGPWVLPGINHIHIYPDVEVYEVAHEMGHVFGLQHEHQRIDRDAHIRFNCPALRGYDAVKKIVEDEHSGIEMNEVCHTSELYNDYKRDVPEFAPDAFDFFMDWDVKARKEYDVDSIMHYHSYSFAYATGNCWVQKQPQHCTLMKYTTDKRGPDAPVDFIAPNKMPSKGDVEALKLLYPWEPLGRGPGGPPADGGTCPAGGLSIDDEQA